MIFISDFHGPALVLGNFFFFSLQNLTDSELFLIKYCNLRKNHGTINGGKDL